MEQGVKDVQENQTTVEKFENIFRNSSERKKVRQSQEEARKESAKVVVYVTYVCRTCNNVKDVCKTCNNVADVCKTCQERATDNSGKV